MIFPLLKRSQTKWRRVNIISIEGTWTLSLRTAYRPCEGCLLVRRRPISARRKPALLPEYPAPSAIWESPSLLKGSAEGKKGEK